MTEISLTIEKEYLAAQAEGELALTVVFDIGGPAVMTITITDTTPFCEIGTTQYHTLDGALAAVLSGETKTIRLLENIDYNKGMSVSGKTVIFDLNGRTLNVVNVSGNALSVGARGVVNMTGDGAFNAIGSGTGVLAFMGGQATVTNAASTGNNGSGAVANNRDDKGTASYVEVTNDATATGSSSTGARAISGGRVRVGRNAEGVFKGADAAGAGSLVEDWLNVRESDRDSRLHSTCL